MLTEYIRRHDLDIIFLQEIAHPELLQMSCYDVQYNIGSDIRGTAIVARNDIILHNINKSPSGRVIAAEYKGLHIVNIYAPSGKAKRTEREHFYNAKVPQLLQTGHGEIIIRGDFNCVLDPADSSGHFHTSMALTEITRGLQLKDTWKQDQNRPVYTHYCNTGASRIDRMYVSRDIAPGITGTDFLPAAFTDHDAVVVHLALGDMGMRKRLPRWKLDPTFLRDE
jgi:exonuclease III